MDRTQFRTNLTGPIASFGTPFDRDGQVDHAAARNMVDFCIEAGSRTVLLTAGDSHYMCLSDQEIADLTKLVCEHTAGRAMVVAADRFYGTDRAIAFAKYAREVGADMVMCLPPHWGGGCTPQSLAEHYAAVAKHAPVMIVTNLFIPYGMNFALETIKAALAASDNIVAVKDDMCGQFVRRMCLLVHDRWAVISGGQKQNHLDVHPYGCDGYLSTLIWFKPQISRHYWSAIEANDMAGARQVIRDHDMPFFDYIMTAPGGFNAQMHGMLELTGLAQRWRRKPYHSLTDAEMEALSDCARSIGLL